MSAPKCMFLTRAIRSLSALGAFVLFLAGCASGNGGVSPGNYLAVLGNGATAYLVLPVERNRELINLFAAGMKNAEGLIKAADRTRMAYAGVFGKNARLVATGKFPSTVSSIIFPRSKGWKKISETGIGSWYRTGAIDAAIPVRNVVCVSSGPGIGDMLTNLRVRPAMDIAPSFSEYAAIEPPDGRIGLYIADSSIIVGKILGPDVSLPVEYAEFFAVPEGVIDVEQGQSYGITGRIALRDARSTRAMMSLVKLAFPGIHAEISGSDLYVSGATVTAEKLVEIAGNMYFSFE